MLELAKTNAVVTLQLAFKTAFGIDPHQSESIRRLVNKSLRFLNVCTLHVFKVEFCNVFRFDISHDFGVFFLKHPVE